MTDTATRTLTVTVPMAPPSGLKKPITTRNSGILDPTKYESRGAALTALGMVRRHRRSPDMSSVRIPLNSRKYPGLFAVVDAADAPRLLQHKWRPLYSPANRKFYAQTHRKDGQGGLMHRMVLGLSMSDPDVDHIDGDGLNNTRANLRPATASQNQANTSKHVEATSSYKGVFWASRERRWVASVHFEGRKICLGYFDAEHDAAMIYDVALVSLFGEYAKPNFPGQTAPSWMVEKWQEIQAGKEPTSQFRGVAWKKSNKKWRAKITIGRKHVHLGYFENEIDAAMAYDRAAREAHGNRATCNFPEVPNE